MTLSSLIEASQACAKENIPLISGVRLRIVEDATVKDKNKTIVLGFRNCTLK